MQPTAATSPGLKRETFSPHPLYPADDLVPRHDGIRGALPLIASLMQIGMTHTAVEDGDLHIPRARLAALE